MERLGLMGVLHGRSAFLAKTEIPSLDPLQYRILLILPILYRRWAALRLRDLAPWIDTWALEEMYAGMRGRGAEDAWWTTALEVEFARLSGDVVIGGVADIFISALTNYHELSSLKCY